MLARDPAGVNEPERPPGPIAGPGLRRSAAREAASFLGSVAGVKALVRVLAAGYSAGLAWWGWTHAPALEKFVLENVLPFHRRQRLCLLVGWSALGWVLAWLVAGMVHARRRQADVGAVLDRLGRWLSVGCLAGLTPVLAIPGFGQRQAWLTFCLVLVGSALTYRLAMRAHPADLQPEPQRQRAGAPAASGLAVLLLAGAYGAFFSLLTIARHHSFATHAFDLGIFDQVMHNILSTGTAQSTVYGPPGRSLFAEHVSPIHYLIAPIYALRPEATTLLILQSLVLASGAIPVWRLAGMKSGQALPAVVLSAAYLLHPALHGVNLYDFHEIAIACPLLLFALWAMESGRTTLFLACLVLAVMTKEEVSLSAAAMGLLLFLFRGRPRLGACLVAGGLAWFLISVRIVLPAFGGSAHLDRFAGLAAPGFEGWTAIAMTLMTNPVYVIQSIAGHHEKLVYLVQMFLPVLCLPILAGAGCILLLPALGTTVLATSAGHFSLSSQYSAHLLPFLFYLSACALSRVAGVRRTAVSAAVLAASLAMTFQFGSTPFSRAFPGLPRPAPHHRAVAGLAASIPSDASVSTQSDIVPHLSARREIYLFPNVAGAEYLLFDAHMSANFDPLPRPDAVERVRGLMEAGEYVPVRLEDECLLLRRSPVADETQVEVAWVDRSFDDFLRLNEGRTLVLVARDDATLGLASGAKEFLAARGSRIAELAYRGSWAALLHGGRVVWEEINNAGPVQAGWRPGETVGGVHVKRRLRLYSAGGAFGNCATVMLDGAQVAVNRRGMNVVLLDDEWNCLRSACFDTHAGGADRFLEPG